MLSPRFHSKTIAVALALFACCSTLRAAISQGTFTTNAVEAEQRRIELFYKAQQSYQEKLQTGQKRFNERQAERAKVIASMAAQLQTREETVPMPPASSAEASAEITPHASQSWLLLTGLAFLLIGLGLIWNRSRQTSDA